MGKTNSTFVRPFWMASLFLLAMILTPVASFAQVSGCQDNILVTLGPACTFDLLPENVRAGGNSGSYVVVSDETIGLGVDRSIINGVGTFDFGLFDSGDVLICWGTVTSEDKTAPVIAVDAAITLDCYLIGQVLNVANSAIPGKNEFIGATATATDNCETPDLVWADNIEYGDCNANFYATITRRWTATDSYGNSSTEVQIINFDEPAIYENNEEATAPTDEFAWREQSTADWTFAFDPVAASGAGQWVLEYSTCNPDDVTVPNVYPSLTDFFSKTVTLDGSICNYSISESSTVYDNVCGDGFKEERLIKVFDWCSGDEVAAFSYIVKVGDFDAPTFGACAFTDTELGVSFANFSLSNPDGILLALNGTAVPDGTPSITPQLIDVSPEVCVASVSTGPMDCTAAIRSDLASLKAMFGNDVVKDCDDPNITLEVLSYGPRLTSSGFPLGGDAWTVGGYVRQNDMIVGLPVGFHALVISASDDCYNSSLGIVFFEVEDKVKPVMKCDDELRVTLVEGDAKLGIDGYALASYQDVDEGSWDNCGPLSLQVRRDITNADARADWEVKNGDLDEDDDYTPWADIVEFFCADVDVPVKVELQGTDSNGKTSICWLNIDVENGTNYGLVLEGDNARISCLEDFDPADFATIVSSGLGCATLDFDLKVVADLNECGDGTYTISIDDSTINDTKNASSIDDREIVVTVALAHQYWIKFPADVKDYCTAIDGPLDYIDISEDEDVACDLLAIYTDTPERFVTNLGDDDCYKLFQTYKVINWCEYDGESIPVIVSRDWDAHNGDDCDGSDSGSAAASPGEYNMNPSEPDGDDKPGNTDLYVIVDVNDATGDGIVYYDNNNDPTDESTKDLTNDNTKGTNSIDEGYWWAVTRKDIDCGQSASWYDDSSDSDDNGGSLDDFDIDGTDNQDDDDDRYGSFGYWQYTQHIIVKDTSAPVVTVGDPIISNDGSLDNLDCDADVTLPIDISDECSVADLTVQVIAEDGTVEFTSRTTDNGDGTASVSFPAGNLPLGTYKWTVKVNDGCGNITEEEVEFDVEDVKAPAPICHNGLKVELMPTEEGDGMAAIWASDFIASDIGDCNGTGGLVTLDDQGNQAPMVLRSSYSIYRDTDFTDSTYVSLLEDGEEAFDLVRGLAVTCDDLAADGSEGSVTVRVYAEDAVGNADYCLTNIEVQNNNGACGAPAPGQIAGAIATENNATVEGVEVQLSGARSMMYMTDAAGNFLFNGLALGGDYTVTPQKDQNHLNGVSTFDLVLISKHILGVQPLNSAYKLIAADVNNSKSVTTLDLIQLRKLILNIDTEFANNTSWRFVDAAHSFANPSNPWASTFPEFKNMNNLSGDLAAAQFVGIKVGDVNNSASVEARSATGTLAINAAEQSMIAGNEYTVTFNANMTDVAGYQFTMNVENAEIVDIVYGAAKAENFGVFSKEGVLTTSFNGEVPTYGGSNLFSLVIRATADVNLSEALTVNSRYTAAEAYSTNDEQLNVALNFTGATAQEAAFSLTQNTPNPFQGETVIGFNLPTAGEATLTIQDVAGRTVKMIEGDFTKGYNQVNLNASDLPSAGVFFYTLTAGELSATKKMIVIDAVNR